MENTSVIRPISFRRYDYAGNRTSQGSLNLANILLENSSHKFVPDEFGTGSLSQKVNLASGAAENFTYRADQKLVSYSKDGMQAEYFYDALGRRVAKRVTKGSDPAFTQSYMHLGEQDKILLGKSGDGEITLYLDGQGIDEHLGEVSSRGVKTYATDHLGSVLNGEAAGAARAFGAWGENLNATAPAIAASSSPVVYGYTGRQLDAESSTYYYRARTYLPDVGKFAQPDPIFPASGVNPYTYVLNSPLNYVDPDGLDAQVYTTILPWGHGVVGVTDPSSSTGTTYYDYGPKSSSSFGLGTPVPGQVNVMPKYPVPLLPIPGMNYPGTPEQDKKARDRANAIKNLPGELYPYTPIPGLTDLPSGMPGNNCYSFTSDVTSVYRNSGAK